MSNRAFEERPKTRNRSSLMEWLGSGMLSENGSAKTVVASSKETLCFRRFDRSLAGSHSNSYPIWQI